MTFQIPGIDTEKALNLYGDDIELYKAVLSACANNAPEVLGKIKKAALDKSLEDFAVNMHGMKGTCGTIGAEDLKKEAIELETMAKAGDTAGVLARSDAFLKQANDLLDSINKWLKQ